MNIDMFPIILPFYKVDPFMPNGISLCYQLEQSFSVLRAARWYFSFSFKF